MSTATTESPLLMQVGRIPVQKLFLLAIVLKVTSSGFGWWFQEPWTLGFAVPLTVMVMYIALGWRRKSADVTDDKFADSCYYLGFIFTITSIIFALFDLPEIGDRLPDIAIRFGAAMVATVFGLAVRVYLVSFKRDAMDAIESAESGVIQSAERFRVQLEMVGEKFQLYESQVVRATEMAAAQVERTLENNARALNGQLTEFFTDLSKDLKVHAKAQISTIGKATTRLEAAAIVTADRAVAGLRKMDEELISLLTTLRGRVESTTLPEDHFTRALAEPLARLRTTANELAQAVTYAEGAILQSGDALEKQAATVGAASEQLEKGLHAVDSATKVQTSTQAQIDVHLATLNTAGERLERGLTAVNSVAKVQTTTQAQIDAHLAALNTAGERLERGLTAVNSVAKLQTTTQAQLDLHLAALNTAGERLERGLTAVDSVAKVQTITQAQLDAHLAALNTAGERLERGLNAVDSVAKVQTSTQAQLDGHLAALNDVRAALAAVEDAIKRAAVLSPSPATVVDTEGIRPLQPSLPLAPSMGGRTPELPLAHPQAEVAPERFASEPVPVSAFPRYAGGPMSMTEPARQTERNVPVSEVPHDHVESASVFAALTRPQSAVPNPLAQAEPSPAALVEPTLTGLGDTPLPFDKSQ